MIENDHLDQNLFICLSVTLVIISTSRKRSLGQGNVLQEFVCPREGGGLLHLGGSAGGLPTRRGEFCIQGDLHPGGWVYLPPRN